MFQLAHKTPLASFKVFSKPQALLQAGIGHLNVYHIHLFCLKVRAVRLLGFTLLHQRQVTLDIIITNKNQSKFLSPFFSLPVSIFCEWQSHLVVNQRVTFLGFPSNERRHIPLALPFQKKATKCPQQNVLRRGLRGSLHGLCGHQNAMGVVLFDTETTSKLDFL